MGLFVKHLAVRLWTSLFFGCICVLVVLPPLAGLVGPGWMIVPGLLMLVFAFWVTGLVFAAIGRRRVARLLDEATVWERVAMKREARKALDRSAATVDSFLFSPRSRKASARRLLAQTARFHMADADSMTNIDGIVHDYLENNPKDREAAIKWLEKILSHEAADRKTHNLVAKIGAANADDPALAQMVCRFYLSERRCDFTALEAYGHLVDAHPVAAGPLMDELAALFLSHSRVDRQALAVYLHIHEKGGRHSRFLPAIAACSQNIVPGPMTRPLLERAETILADMDYSQRADLSQSFLPDESKKAMPPSQGQKRFSMPALGPVFLEIIANTKKILAWLAKGISDKWHDLWRILRSRNTRLFFKWTTMGAAIVGVGWLLFSTFSHLRPAFHAVDPSADPVTVTTTDPFTIQVAAFTTSSEAKSHVSQLKEHGLNAYWKQATGTQKTWYQVRISHFPTKAAARAAGDEMKRKGLIADYYVANFRPPDPK